MQVCRRYLLGCAALLTGIAHAASLNAPATVVVDAARADDLPAVRKLIKELVDVNRAANDGSSALLWAAFHSNEEMTKALLAGGAMVDAANHFGVTPLLQASRIGDAPVMKALLDAGADATRWHPEGETPLMAAAHTGHVDAVRLLLSHGAFVNAVDPFQEETALMWAAAEGHADVAKVLLAAGADPNLKAHVSLLTERKNADHPSGGFTALMFAARNGHEDVVKALVAGGADLKLTNADGATATIIAIVNARFDLAKELIDLGADPNDGALFFAVDMHDATTDMRAQDATRLQPDHLNHMTAMTLVKALLDLKADVNKPFSGALHSTSMCCNTSLNSTPFYRAATASDVEMLKLLLSHGAQLEGSPTELKPKDGKKVAPAMNANVGKTPLMAALKGGLGAPVQGGPGYSRTGPPSFREPGSREPIEAVQVLLAAGANPNAKAPDGSTPLHQAVQERQVALIRALAGAGGSLDAVNKDNLSPLAFAAKLKDTPEVLSVMGDPGAYRRKRDSYEDVIVALRDLMHLSPGDPIPAPPPPVVTNKDKEQKKTAEASAVTIAQ